jgi:glutamine amidotransferase
MGECKNTEQLVAVTEYGEDVTAIVSEGNVFGTQFHPEKSGETGLKLLSNFGKML